MPQPEQKDMVHHMLRGMMKDIDRVIRMLNEDDALVIQRLRSASHDIKIARAQLK